MTNLLNVVLMMPQGGGQNGGGILQIVFILAMIAVFYFFMIRPQVKRQKELAKFRSGLKKGDKVITTGGIYGKISEVSDAHIMVEIANDVLIKVDKSAIIADPADLAQQK
jgi:preprotein translocase subunit YajC